MSNENDERNVDDVAPGFMDSATRSIKAGIRSYLIGLALSVLLTALSFYLVGAHFIWEPGLPAALASLAIAQIGVHLIFFLHITTAPDNTNTVLALAFGVLIVGLIIGGSVWIMAQLHDRVMPIGPLTGMPG
ncbi:MAG TPA: cytochrome o ubiquinol oxidase subunit IV [Methylocella sp.]|nr:cytochrome o ubiquinol oxidase subunit IV [Methylocella sp.]